MTGFKRAGAFDIIKAINSLQHDHIEDRARASRDESGKMTLTLDPKPEIASLLAQGPAIQKQHQQEQQQLAVAPKPKLSKIETDIPPSPIDGSQYHCEKPEEIPETLKLLATSKAVLDKAFPRALAAQRAASGNRTRGRVILLTGANGALGSHTLQSLAETGGADRVYCLVRAKDEAQAEQRLEESLKTRSLSSLADLRAMGIKITCHPADYDAPRLGMTPTFLDELKKNVHSVLHFAWSVRHIAPIHKFRDNINSIIYLATYFPLSRHYFVSSISAILAWDLPETGAPEDLTPDVRTAWSGYGRSKWVAEQLYAHASSLGLDATILRSTQLVGDRKTGLWSPSDTIAVMLRAGPHLGALPNRDVLGTQVCWLPMDQAGWICAAITTPDRPRAHGFEFFNLGPNKLVPFTEVLEVLRQPENYGPAFAVQEFGTFAKKTSTPTSPTVRYQRMFDYFSTFKTERFLAVPKLEEALKEALEAKGYDPVSAEIEVNEQMQGVTGDLIGKMARLWRSQGLVPKPPPVAARL